MGIVHSVSDVMTRIGGWEFLPLSCLLHHMRYKCPFNYKYL